MLRYQKWGELLDGKIYIFEHQSGTTIKVGHTIDNPERRLSDYSKRYDLKGFRLAKTYVVDAYEREEIEKRAHHILNDSGYLLSGIDSAREIFSCDLATGEAAVEEAILASERSRAQHLKIKAQQKKLELDEKLVTAIRNSFLKAMEELNEEEEVKSNRREVKNIQRQINELSQKETSTFWFYILTPLSFFIVFAVSGNVDALPWLSLSVFIVWVILRVRISSIRGEIGHLKENLSRTQIQHLEYANSTLLNRTAEIFKNFGLAKKFELAKKDILDREVLLQKTLANLLAEVRSEILGSK